LVVCAKLSSAINISQDIVSQVKMVVHSSFCWC